jgi:short-subunit dehydrogenase
MKHVVLQGATDGIGLALARAWVARGWRVGLLARNEDKLRGVVEELRQSSPGAVVLGGVCDAADTDRIGGALGDLIYRLGQMDLFVYCAGVAGGGPTLQDRLRAIDPIVDVNIRGAFHALEWAADYFETLRGGRIAAIGSVAGERGRKGNPVYGASKAALHHYLEGLRNRLLAAGVGVSVIKPGWVRTRMLGGSMAESRLVCEVDRAADIIADGLEHGREDFFVPWWWALVSRGLRWTPRPLYKRIAPP